MATTFDELGYEMLRVSGEEIHITHASTQNRGIFQEYFKSVRFILVFRFIVPLLPFNS